MVRRLFYYVAALLLIIVALMCVTPAQAQRSNTFYVDQFAGADIGAKTTNAQKACNADAAIPCIIVFDPLLAKYSLGTMPAACAQCRWKDYSGIVGGDTGTLAVKGDIVQAAGLNDVFVNHVITTTSPNGAYPLGGDLVLLARGSSDLYMQHAAAKTTAAGSLIAGVNNGVVVLSTSGFSGAAALVIGRETPNEEFVSEANFTIVDATHVNITCAKAHTVNNANNNSKPLIDVEQGIGNTSIEHEGGGGLAFFNKPPSQMPAGVYPMTRLMGGSDNVAFALFPNSSAATFPRNAINFLAPITGSGNIGGGGGVLPTPGDLVIRNSSASNSTRVQSSAGGGNFTVFDTVLEMGVALQSAVTGGTPAQSGTIRFLTGDQIRFRNNANNADIVGLSKDTSDVVYIGGAAGVNIQKIQGAGNATAGKVMCWKTTTTLGYCSTIVDSVGACTCN